MENSRCIYYLFTEHNYAADSQQIVAEVAVFRSTEDGNSRKVFFKRKSRKITFAEKSLQAKRQGKRNKM